MHSYVQMRTSQDPTQHGHRRARGGINSSLTRKIQQKKQRVTLFAHLTSGI